MICGDLTVAHTSAKISPFSVTSFYEVGLAMGLIGRRADRSRLRIDLESPGISGLHTGSFQRVERLLLRQPLILKFG